MKVAVIGVGYVGLVTGVCFSEMGNNVVCADINSEKINKLNQGEIPIYEPGLKDLLHNSLHKTLFFTDNVKEAIQQSDIIFIAVGTPMQEDGNADLSAVFSVAKFIGSCIESHKIIVTKSTVPVGTTFKVKDVVQEELNERGLTIDFDVVSNPEFLKEGAAVNDFMKPDRIVIGAENEGVFSTMKQLYSPFFRTRERFIEMDIASSEMTKYAANAMLATKISFINEMATICEKVGANINDVRVGIGSDARIGYDFIYPGVGYGGTCFPKDIAALIKIGEQNGYKPKLISSVEEVNKNQKKRFLDRIYSALEGVNDKNIAVWGLSFKPETDDVRESPAIYIVEKLVADGANVKLFDPKAVANFTRVVKSDKISYAKDKYEAVKNVEALILLTEWKEFRSPNFEILKSEMKKPFIFDGRNQYQKFNLKEKGFQYYQIGVQ